MKHGDKLFQGLDDEKFRESGRQGEAVRLMEKLQRMSHEAKQLEKAGQRDKIDNFNNEFIQTQIKLNNLVRKYG